MFGVVLISGTPAIVMSEGQATYALSPGPNTPQSLTLKGVLGSGYIQCGTDAGNLANNGCSGSFDTTTGLYTLTAVGADYNGFPIVYQAGVGFDNGGPSRSSRPRAAPISCFRTTVPSRVPAPNSPPLGAEAGTSTGSSAYGQPFNVQCVHLGTAALGPDARAGGSDQPGHGFHVRLLPAGRAICVELPGVRRDSDG